jgi:hypothetical protein
MDGVPNGKYKASATYVVLDSSDSDSDSEGNNAFSLLDIVLSFHGLVKFILPLIFVF